MRTRGAAKQRLDPRCFEAVLDALAAELAVRHRSIAAVQHVRQAAGLLFAFLRRRRVRDLRAVTDAHITAFARELQGMRSSRGRMAARLYPCVCCGFPTLTEPPPGTFEVCPVCFWEDDDAQFRDREYAGGANSISLAQAQDNFARFGAITEEHRAYVRPPTDRERSWKGLRD